MADVNGVSSYDQIVANRTKYKDYFSENQSGSDISMDTFITLLMAEMSNQNPLEPMSNTEFVSQMAQFTSLQAMQDLSYNSNASYAANLVGKTVTIRTSQNEELVTETGIVTGVKLKDNDFQVTVNGNTYPMSTIKEIKTVASGGSTGGNTDSASGMDYASSLIGKYVTVQYTDDSGQMLYAEGLVDSTEIQDGEAMIVIEDLAFPLDSIVRVSDKSSIPVEDETDADDELEDIPDIEEDEISDEGL